LSTDSVLVMGEGVKWKVIARPFTLSSEGIISV